MFSFRFHMGLIFPKKNIGCKILEIDCAGHRFYFINPYAVNGGFRWFARICVVFNYEINVGNQIWSAC